MMFFKTQSVWYLVVATGLLLFLGTARAGEQNRPALAVSSFDAQTAKGHQEGWAKYLGQPVEVTNSIGMKLKLIPAGEFQMGSPESDWRATVKQHVVRITKPFYLGVTEVTQEQYERMMGQNPSNFKGDPQRPVESVSWADAVAFCRKLSEKEGRKYRLPTEAEWEYACRAGSKTKWCFGDDEATLKEYAWYGANSGSSTHPVAQKKPNAWALYDMHGNVWEWCHDWFDEQYYAGSPTEDPTGPDSGSSRVLRGGAWHLGAPGHFRCAYRDSSPPGYRDHSHVFPRCQDSNTLNHYSFTP